MPLVNTLLVLGDRSDLVVGSRTSNMSDSYSSNLLVGSQWFYTVLAAVLTILGTVLLRQYIYVRLCNMIPGPRIDIPCLGGGFELVFVKPESMIIQSSFNRHNSVRKCLLHVDIIDMI